MSVNIDMQHKLLSAYMGDGDLFEGVENLVRNSSKSSVWTSGLTQKTYETIKHYHEKGIKPDPNLIYKSLAISGLPKQEISIVKEWKEIVLTKEQVKEYVEVLFSDYVTAYLSPVIRSCAYNIDSADPFEEMGRLKDAINNVEMALAGVSKHKSVKEYFKMAVTRMKDLQSGKIESAGFSWGLKKLNERTIGILQGINVVAGDKGCGKTSLVINILVQHAIYAKKPALVFSLEMPGVELITNIIANVKRINSKNLRTGNLMEDDMLSIEEIYDRLDNDSFVIDETGGITWQYFEASCKSFRKKNKIPKSESMLVVLDYLGLMKNSSDEAKMSKEEKIEHICVELMRICKNENIALVLLAQFSRESGKRGSDTAYIRDPTEQKRALLKALRPRMTDLKGSSAIESNAVNIVLLYRPEYYGITECDGNSYEGLCEINTAKARFASPGPIYTKFTGKYNLFEDEDEPQNGDIITDGEEI